MPAKNKLFIQADALHRQGEFAAAEAIYKQLLAQSPNHAELIHRLGLLQMEQGNLQTAMDWIEKSIALNGTNASYFSNYAVVMNKLKHFEAALLCADTAISMKPTFAAAYSNRGNALLGLQRFEEALQCYQKALQLDPRFTQAHLNKSIALKEQGRYGEALQTLAAALHYAPQHQEARWNQALALLQSGDFERGWKEYEWRFVYKSLKISKSKYDFPVWLGKEPLQGKTIFVYHEQGYGDAIQFARYAKLLAKQGAKVLLEVHAPLRNLFAPLREYARIVQINEILPHVDYQCPVMSLPLAFNTRLDTIPAEPRYLQTPLEKLQHWRVQLGPKRSPQALRIGLAWSGNKDHVNDHNRSMALHTLLTHLPPLSALPAGSQYISLQRDIRDTDVAALQAHPDLLHFGHALEDFGDTAALCELVDVVLSVDTSTAHLGGALGLPTWVMLPFDPEWRWLLERNDSPWYPSVRLYRQSRPKDWAGLLSDVGRDLLTLTPRNAV